jgi:hypothetical protein
VSGWRWISDRGDENLSGEFEPWQLREVASKARAPDEEARDEV